MAGLRLWPDGRDLRETCDALYNRGNDLPVWTYVLIGMMIGLSALALAGMLVAAAVFRQYAAS